MITLALAVLTVALGGVAVKMWHDKRDARRTVNLLRNVEHMLRAEAKAEALVAEQNERLLTNAENAARIANEKATHLTKVRGELECYIVERSRSAAQCRRRYEAALRALRTRQAVIDGLARELKYVGRLSEHFQDEARTNKDVAESESRMRRVELMLHESQVEQLIRNRDRLAAQLKRMKARKA